MNLPQLLLAALLGAMTTGCIATMSQLHEPTSRAERRRACTDYVNNSASFVALANGKTESWVADRTGHMSSQMINRYKRWARGHQEQSLGDWVPLHLAIPELANCAEQTVAVQSVGTADVGVLEMA
jgi:hypothetical protein